MESTNHVVERYCERVLRMTDAEIKEFLVPTKREELKATVSELFETAKFVYTGKYNDNAVANYYISDDLLFVVNQTNQAIMTLYFVEFGFAKYTNQKIIEDLMNEIESLYKDKEDIQPFIAGKVADIDTQITLNDVEIESLNNRLKFLEENRKSLEMQKAVVLSSVKGIDEKIHVLASKICYSVNYKMDILKKK